MRKIHLLLVFNLLFVGFGFSEIIPHKINSYISIEDLIEKSAIDVSVLGVGGYQEECIDFEITNNTDSILYLRIEPGRRLVSQDSTLQDIFIVKEVLIDLIARSTTILKGYGFCCEATCGSPYKNSIFSIGFMAPESWIKLAEVINKYDFPTSAVQSAIWVLSNDHSFSSVHSDDLEKIAPLRKTLAEILDLEIPWYTLSYVQDTTTLFSDRPEKIYGEFEYYVANNCIITINIRNNNGEVVKTLVKESPVSPGTYTYTLNQDVSLLPKGDYEVYIYEDYAKLKLKKKFTL